MTPIKRLHDVDLNLLLALEALLEEGHVTRAAKRVGLTQPAMSHALKRLRDLLGDPLFVRIPRGILPTARAKALAAPLSRILADVRAMLSDEAFDPATSKRHFTLCAPDVGQLVVLPALLEAVRARAPYVRIASGQRPPDYLERLESGDIDLMIGGEKQLPPQLRKQLLVTSRLVVIGRADHPQLGDKLTAEQFADLPHIEIAFRRGLGGSIDEEMRERGLSPRFVLSMSDLVTAMFVVAKSDLVVVAGELVLKMFADALPLRGVPIPVKSTVSISQIWHERQHADPAHVWFRTQVRDAVAKVAG